MFNFILGLFRPAHLGLLCLFTGMSMPIPVYPYILHMHGYGHARTRVRVCVYLFKRNTLKQTKTLTFTKSLLKFHPSRSQV